MRLASFPSDKLIEGALSQRRLVNLKLIRHRTIRFSMNKTIKTECHEFSRNVVDRSKQLHCDSKCNEQLFPSAYQHPANRSTGCVFWTWRVISRLTDGIVLYSPLFLVEHWRSSFVLGDLGVVVDSDNQFIAKSLGLTQSVGMTEMNHVIAKKRNTSR